MNPQSHRNRRPPVTNATSNLLSDSENDKTFRLLGKRCVTLATTVAQVFLTQNNSRWVKKSTGVCCFVKDNPQRSYFIRVYNINSERLIFEQELYNQFRYHAPRPYFHTFDTDDCKAGLNFADEMEASMFKNVVEDKIRAKQEKKQAKTQRPPPPSSPRPPVPNHQNNVQAHTNSNQSPSLPMQAYEIQGGAMHDDNKKDKKKKKGKKGKLTKAEIGIPQGFKHVGHVGWDPNKGFDMNEMDPAIKDLFATAGVTEQQMQDKETAKFIYDFIEKQGGVDAVKRDIPPPPPPSRRGRDGPPPPPPSRAGQAPPPPQRNYQGGHPPPPPNRSGPPPPPPSNRYRPPESAPMPPPSRARGPPPPPPQANIPPPPPPQGNIPPPPPMCIPAPPPPPPSGGGGNSAGRGGLLDQIRGGSTLKSASERQMPEAPASGGRGALLDQIRLGKQLKTVSSDAREKPPMDDPDEGGIAGALARALQQREKAIHTDSESDSDEDFNDDDEDWED